MIKTEREEDAEEMGMSIIIDEGDRSMIVL